MRILDKITKEWGDIIAFSDLTWTERDGVWIPTSINLELHFNGREAYYAALDWESVNQTPAESLFRPDGLGLDPDSIIVDQRLGDKPVVIGKIKDNGRPPAPPERIEPSRSTTDRVYWILVGNAVALGLLGACYLWHRLHRG